VNRFVPVQSFLHESKQNGLDRIRLTEGDLVLDYHMNNSMQVFVWEANPFSVMVLLNRLDALGFI
jgi:hypothetical protein